MSFRNFWGTMGQKPPLETLPARRWAPAGRKTSWRDDLSSKRCISAQLFSLVAIVLKFTASAGAEAATVSANLGGGGEGRDKKLASKFFSPGRYNICTLNSEIKTKWHCWQISPKLERSSFIEMAKMLNCGECCQQFPVKSGVTRFHVS